MAQKNLWEQGYRLTTAEIFYHVPAEPNKIKSIVWQELDQAPDYPVLKSFLKFWNNRIDVDVDRVEVNGNDQSTLHELQRANFSVMVH